MLTVLVSGSLLASAVLAAGGAQSTLSPADAAIAKNVQLQLTRYGNYTMFDDVSFRMQGRQVTLTGSVTEPFQKADMEKIAAKVPGVEGVTDNIRVLPFSDADNALRRKIATAFDRDPALARYQQPGHSTIHVVVDQGKATLDGAVRSLADRTDAALLSQYAGSTVTINDLQVVPGL